MTRREKAQRIQETLERLYPTVDIPLAHDDPFTLLVAVVLSAQTTDKMVNEVTPALFARAATPEALASLPVRFNSWARCLRLRRTPSVIVPCGRAGLSVPPSGST